jgi:uncharacterized protein YdeI (YjbR/CyaY-like superfamily)
MTTDKITAYIEKNARWKAELTLLRKLMLQTGMEETVKWGAPVYTASNSQNVLGLGGFKHHFCIWFFQGALLKDSHKKLLNAQEGKTNAMLQWRFEHINEVDEKLVLAYAKEALANAEANKKVAPIKKTAVEMPIELEEVLKSDKQLKSQFEKLTPYKQKEYKEHIGSAKQEKTRIARLEKCIPMILAGTGLNDKYKNC